MSRMQSVDWDVILVAEERRKKKLQAECSHHFQKQRFCTDCEKDLSADLQDEADFRRECREDR